MFYDIQRSINCRKLKVWSQGLGFEIIEPCPGTPYKAREPSRSIIYPCVSTERTSDTGLKPLLHIAILNANLFYHSDLTC